MLSSDDELVVPYSASNSELIKVLTESGDDLMPPLPYAPLSSVQIAKITEWINNGATNEECDILCDTTIFTYSEAISDIMLNNCQGCHSGNSPAGNLSITNYEQVKAIADNGSLIETVKAINGSPLMPPSQSLDDCEIRQIEKWIESGSPSNLKF